MALRVAEILTNGQRGGIIHTHGARYHQHLKNGSWVVCARACVSRGPTSKDSRTHNYTYVFGVAKEKYSIATNHDESNGKKIPSFSLLIVSYDRFGDRRPDTDTDTNTLQ